MERKEEKKKEWEGTWIKDLDLDGGRGREWKDGWIKWNGRMEWKEGGKMGSVLARFSQCP